MRVRIVVIFVAVVMMASSTFLTGAEARQRKTPPKIDAISGNWDAALEMESGASSFNLTLKLKLTGDEVTGEFVSDHIGTGKVSNGSWAANKLILTVATNHGAMLLTGKLEKGKLTGQFNAGQMQGTWQANKKWNNTRSQEAAYPFLTVKNGIGKSAKFNENGNMNSLFVPIAILLKTALWQITGYSPLSGS